VRCSNVKDAPTKRLAALLGVVSAGLSALVVRPVNTYQGFILKSTATAQTPALTVLGALTAALGAIRRSRFAMITGVLGASVGTYYITRVTTSHDGHERAFGPAWKQRIRPDDERRMLQHRRSMRLPRVPAPRWARDVPFWTIPGTDRQLLADIWEPAAGVERLRHGNRLPVRRLVRFSTKTSSRAHSSASSPRRATSSWTPRTGAAPRQM
jgi:hypothetical protein